jgi:hypothetical protein
MKSRRLLPVFLPFLLACMPCAALAQSPPAQSGPVSQLDVSAGRWVYHGHFIGGKGTHPSAWTWHEDCRWSANRVFMLCSFSNTWGGRHVDSEVVDTYDPRGSSFWHYEIFDSGDAAGKPFASKMRIDGATRIEWWTETRHGKSVRQRIVYKFASDREVTVLFQRSTDGSHWDTTATGTGEKVGA